MYTVGIDLGGTNIAAGVVDEKGTIVRKISRPTKRKSSADEIMDEMADMAFAVCADAGIEISDIDFLGIGCPGTVDSERGVVLYSNNIPMENVSLQSGMERRTGKAVGIENDANAAALGEYEASGCGDESFVHITLGTGVGSGVILNGKIYKGFNAAAAEMGHITIVSGGERCSCGKAGCWEAYASATALVRQTKKAIEENGESVLSDMREINGKDVFEAAKNGDETAKRVVKQYERYVADGLVSIVNILQPKKITIGGGVSGAGEKFFEEIKKYVGENSFNKSEEKTEIEKAGLGNDAGIVGAAMAARKSGFKRAVKMTPIFKDYIWGGVRLKSEMNKKSSFERTAESWELSVNKNGQSMTESGETFEDYIAKNAGCLGKGCNTLPILIKLIDARENLSVQVHPADEYAKVHEGCLGKSEMWYIIDCDEGAKLYCGFKRDTNRAEVLRKTEDGTFCDLLNAYEVKKGDAFYIPAGEVHAIGGEILLMEIQENSDVTYRVYDYGRGRRLDLKKAFDVMNMKKSGGARVKLPLECEYFNVRKQKLPKEKEIKMSSESFVTLTVTEGCCIMYANGKKTALERGETAFVPAQDGVAKLEGNGEIIAVERGSK